MTYILYRGLKYDLNLVVADLKVLFDIILTQLAAVIRIPFFSTLVLYITLVFRLLMEFMSSIDLSLILKTVSINCKGSQVFIVLTSYRDTLLSISLEPLHTTSRSFYSA